MSDRSGIGRAAGPPPPSPHVVPFGGAGLAGGGGGIGISGTGGAGPTNVSAADTEEQHETKFQDLCKKVLARKDHKEASVRRTVMALLPELAAFFPAGAGDLLEPAMWSLIHTLRKVSGSKSIICRCLVSVWEFDVTLRGLRTFLGSVTFLDMKCRGFTLMRKVLLNF